MRQRVRALLREKLELRLPESVRMLTTFEVASFLRVSRDTLSDWRASGAGPPFVKLSRRILRYPRRGFERFMDQRLQSASLGR
jgi:predicted DNA-binding transcriptional regulator AlpA